MNAEDIKIFNKIKALSPLSKYFDLITPDNISKSYKWYEKKPYTQIYFPKVWDEFLEILINKNETPKQVESIFNKQANLNDFITNGKPTGDKGWYGSTTARLFYIPNKGSRKIQEPIPKNEIIEHINIVCEEWKKSQYTYNKLLDLINIWMEKYKNEDAFKQISWKEVADYESFVKQKIDFKKIESFSTQDKIINDSKIEKYLPPKTIVTNITEDIISDNKQIGNIGENIVENILNKKYGVDSVTRTNDFDLCDFIVNLKEQKKIYVEVKTSKSDEHFYISRNELEFVREIDSEYHIYFVYNIDTNRNNIGNYLLPEIKTIFDFKYKFDMLHEPYNKQGFFHLMPTKFKGKIPS